MAALKWMTKIWAFWPAQVALEARDTVEAASHSGNPSLGMLCARQG